MLLLSLVILAVTASYAAMLYRLAKGWRAIGEAEDGGRTVTVTVIVPARNEEANIRLCLTDLLRQDFPKENFHVVMVDDSSDDSTLAIARDMAAQHPNLTVMQADGHGKKAALQQAIDATDSVLIATVDADCRVSEGWLPTMVAVQQRDAAAMVLGPVVLSPATTLFERIQQMEFLAIMGVTGGAAAIGHPVMANGANLLFSRLAYVEAGGYSGSDNPSGDDVFLMLKMKENGADGRGRVSFARDVRALVSTAPVSGFRDFWQQRKRWLSKKGGYADLHVKTTAVLTYFANLAGLIALVCIPFVFPSTAADLLITSLMVKTLADLFFIRMVARDLLPTCGVRDILPAELFILVYTSLLGLVGKVSSYRWKGREVNVKD